MHGGGNCTVAEAASSSTPELKLVNVGGVFLVLGIGLLCSIVIGLVEFLWNLKTVAIEEKVCKKIPDICSMTGNYCSPFSYRFR